MFINKALKNEVGFTYLMNQMKIISPYGKKHMKKNLEYTSQTKDELENELDRLGTMIKFINDFDNLESIVIYLEHLKDITGIINHCAGNGILDTVDLFEIKSQCIYIDKLRVLLNEDLKIEYLKLIDCRPIIKVLSEEGKLTTEFHIYSSYTNKLKTIRDKKRKIEHEYFKVTDESMKRDLQSKRSKYVIMEQEEELIVRQELSSILKEYMFIMKENIKKLGHFDFLYAKAELALKYQGIRPKFSNGALKLSAATNPYIKEKVEELENIYTPISIEMTEGTTILTGANMGGKTSALKTILVNVLLGQYGFYVFAGSVTFPLFDCMRFISSSNSGKIHGLSSFGLEISSINEVIKCIKERKCLVCVDEFARSTNPEEGQKFVKAFAQFANSYSSLTLLSTHYDAVASSEMNHYQVVGLKDDIKNRSFINAESVLTNIHKYMDYSLKKVSVKKEVPKEAYSISLLLNLDEDFKKCLDNCYEEDSYYE